MWIRKPANSTSGERMKQKPIRNMVMISIFAEYLRRMKKLAAAGMFRLSHDSPPFLFFDNEISITLVKSLSNYEINC